MSEGRPRPRARRRSRASSAPRSASRCAATGSRCGCATSTSEHVRTASGLGAGIPAPAGREPALVVVAVPPDLLGPEIARALTEHDTAVVTDVGSVKSEPLARLRAHLPDDDTRADRLRRYVGSHPMAGSERSGPLASSASLFDGRPWAVTPHAESASEAVDAVVALAELLRRDRAADRPGRARRRGGPDLARAAPARRARRRPARRRARRAPRAVGPGRARRHPDRRRETRRCGSRSSAATPTAVLGLLGEVRGQLDLLIDAVSTGSRQRAGGAAGPWRRRHPGDPGQARRPDAGRCGRSSSRCPTTRASSPGCSRTRAPVEVNIEDIHIDHDPGRPVGLVELLVEEARAEHLLASLESRGWVTHR